MFKFNPLTSRLDLVGTSGGGAGTVTSVSEGAGIQATPNPIVGAGSIALDIFSLTAETTLAAGDLFAFVDVSEGTDPGDQRSIEFADVLTAISAGLSGVFQPLDAGLTALAGLTPGGIAVTDGADAWVTRSLAVTDTASIDFTLSNASGVAGNPTITASVLPAGVDHNLLANLAVGDVHTQYLLLAGRAGTANDPLISTGAIGTVTGSDDASGVLALIGSSDTTKGPVRVNDVTFTHTGGTLGLLQIGGTITNNGGSSLNFLEIGQVAGSPRVVNITTAPVGRGVIFQPSVRNTTPGSAVDLGAWILFGNAAQFRTNNTTGETVAEVRTFADSPTFNRITGGDITCAILTSLDCRPTVSTGATVSLRRGVRFLNIQGAGGVQTDVIGFDYEAQTAAGLNIAFRNQDVAASILSAGPVRIGPSLAAPTSALDVEGNIQLIASPGTGSLVFFEASPGTNFTAIQAAAVMTGDVQYTLPDAAPTISGQHLAATTAGVMSWVTATTGTVTSVAGGTGITNSPEPIVGAGTVDLDINSLTAETALASGDFFAFVDVSAVGTAIVQQRKITYANLAAAIAATGVLITQENDATTLATTATLDFDDRDIVAGTLVSAVGTEANINMELYWLRTGRPTGRNTYVLSSDTTTALVSGGTAGGQNVDYQSTTSGTKGRIHFRDATDIGFVPTETTGTFNVTTIYGAAFEHGGGTLRLLTSQSTCTVNDDNLSVLLARHGITYSSAGSVTRDAMNIQSFLSNPTYTPGASASFTNITSRGLVHSPTFSNAGTGNTVTSNYAVAAGGTMNTNWAVTDWALGIISDPGADGAITRLGGVIVNDLTSGTSNFSLWSKGAGVFMAHGGDALIGAIQSTLTAPSATLHAQESVAITDGTIGGEVFRLETVATNDDPNFRVFHGRVTTTNATVTTLLSFAIPATTAVLLEARIMGRRTGGAAGAAEDCASYVIIALVKNVAGTATLSPGGVTGSPTVVFDNNDVAGYNGTIDVNGGNARVRVTGAANTNVTWHCTLFVQTVGS